MPPSRRSSSSHSSRSHRSISSHRSSSHSHSSHSSYSRSSHNSYSSSGRRSQSSGYVTRSRINQPARVPRQIKKNSICMHCQNHDYLYYDTSWQDTKTGIIYQKGYYDENGKYYGADEITFKHSDGSYTAHYTCNYCGTESENTWKEGFFPVCQNCGAQMEKQPVFIDDIICIEKYSENEKIRRDRILENLSGIFYIIIQIIKPFALFAIAAGLFYLYVTNYVADHKADESNYYEESQVTNLDIYGADIYLIDTGNHTYEICEPDEAYDKHLEWDYGADSYYDYESNCYLWYNTDVAPNLWQYWYDDIAGDNDYGWMECENDTWYIETSDTEWIEYTGDTSNLWHIRNHFD